MEVVMAVFEFLPFPNHYNTKQFLHFVPTLWNWPESQLVRKREQVELSLIFLEEYGGNHLNVL